MDNIGVWATLKHEVKPPEKRFKDPADLWKAAVKYFVWCQDNPLTEVQLIGKSSGTVGREKVDRPRAMTIQGLCAFLHISGRCWRNWRDRAEFADVVERIEQVMYCQKFEYAAVDMMNAGLISRELGLANRNELTGRDGGPLQQQHGVDDALGQLLSEIAASGRRIVD